MSVDDLAQQGTRQFLRGVEASVSHYAPTAGDFLTNVAGSEGDPTYISAIPVEEQEIFNYNDGSYNPLNHLPPRNPLDAVYPAGGTLFADHPFVVLNASWVSAAQRQIAASFKDWLQQSAQQARFAAAGFRSFQHRAGPELASDPGIIPGQPSQTLSTPAPNVLAAIVGSWQSFRKAARIALVLDISSPAQRAAVIAGVKNLGDSDEVGVWSSTPQRLLPISLLRDSRSQVMAAIAAAPLSIGRTALYSAIDQAYSDLSGDPDVNRINAIVVIAAASDSGAPPTLTVLERELLTPKMVPIRVYTVGLGKADRSALQGVELASGGYASRLSDPTAAIRTCLANF